MKDLSGGIVDLEQYPLSDYEFRTQCKKTGHYFVVTRVYRIHTVHPTAVLINVLRLQASVPG